MTPAAAALLRALIARTGVERDRILLSDAHSTDWQSLTFNGQRHRLELRVTGWDSREIVARMRDGLEDAEFSIAGLFVADIAVVGTPQRGPDGATELTIEALTIAGD
jgi:hypothetical protein